MRGGRPAHVLDADADAVDAAFSDPSLSDAQRLELYDRWAPLTEAEELSRSSGDALRVWCEVFDVDLPTIPAWLNELAGITERARYMLAALIEVADPVGRIDRPERFLRERFRLSPGLTSAIDSLTELRAVRLIRGDAARIVLTRRLA